MAEKKKMYVVFCEDNEKYWCSYNTWSDQLRKATIFHSTKYANEVHKRFKEIRLKNVEVRMGVVPEKPTNADLIRAMSDEELAKFIDDIAQSVADGEYCTLFLNVKNFPYSCEDTKKACVAHVVEWLQQPAEEGERWQG